VTVYHYHSQSESDTALLAEAFAKTVYPGAVITLDGDLGAGKTAFAQSFAFQLGVRDVVNSPTFTIIKEYKDVQPTLYHMDVYRISLEEADELGLEEYFDDDGVCLIEWARKIDELLPEDRVQIEIFRQGDDERLLKVTPFGKNSDTWCAVIDGKGVFG